MIDDVAEVTPAPQVFERELSEWMDFRDTGLSLEELPKPTTWHVLILPKQPKKMSKGGIALPDQAQEAEMHLNYIGQVLAMGPLSGLHDKFKDPRGAHCWNVKLLDWVLFGKYSGQVITYKDMRLVTVNDDAILHVVSKPDGLKVYV